MLAACAKTVALWDSKTYKVTDSFPKESVGDWEFIDFSWSCDHKHLAVLGLFGPVEVLNVEDGKILSSQKLINEGIKEEKDCYPTAVAFMKNSSRYLAVGNSNGSVIIWDCKANITRKTLTLDGSKGEVKFLDFNSFDSHVAAGMSSGNVLVHEYSGTEKKSYEIPQSTRVTAMRYQTTAHSSVVGAGSAEGHVAFWNTITGAEIGTILGSHDDAVADISFSPANAKLVAAVSQNGRLCFYEFAQRKVLMTCETVESLTTIDLCADDMMAVVGTRSGRILNYDIRSLGQPIASFDLLTPIKKIRYAQATAGNTSIGATRTSPSNGNGYGIFSPLRSDSCLESSDGSYLESNRSLQAANTSATNKSLLRSVLVPSVKVTSTPMNQGSSNTNVPTSDGYRFGIFSPLRSDSYLDSSNSVYGNESTNLSTQDWMKEPASVSKSFLVPGDLKGDTSTPLQDASLRRVSFVDNATNAEISPISEASTVGIISPTSPDGPVTSLLNLNIVGELAVEQSSDLVDRESRISEDESSLLNGEWDSDVCLSSDEEFHSPNEEAGPKEKAVIQPNQDLEETQTPVSLQSLHQMLTENFTRLFNKIDNIEMRLTRLESSVGQQGSQG